MESQTLETLSLVVITSVSIGSYLLILGKSVWQETYGFSLESPKADIFSRVEHK